MTPPRALQLQRLVRHADVEPVREAHAKKTTHVAPPLLVARYQTARSSNRLTGASLAAGHSVPTRRASANRCQPCEELDARTVSLPRSTNYLACSPLPNAIAQLQAICPPSGSPIC